MNLTELRAARPEEAEALSALALRSKAHWGYSAEFLEACRAELTLTAAGLAQDRAVVAESGGRVLGFYALAGDPPDGELAHLWVDPPHIGSGVGGRLWAHAVDTARALGFRTLLIDADPNAEGFYLAMGAERVGATPSASIPGRELPQLSFAVG